jgi:uncharacterized oxidoreductase
MLRLDHVKLKCLIERLFEAVGCHQHEANRIAHYLVEANLAGHDSHGLIRAPIYVDYLRRDMLRANQSLTILFQTEAMAIVDGNFGFGQVIGEQAMRLGVELATRHGVAAIALRNSGHLGRIGDWAEFVAERGMASIHFVNTSGFGMLVAPFGGMDRRLSANPIAVGVPLSGRPPIILDISTSMIAEGKIKVARNRGSTVPAGCIIDNQGRPTTSPADFYADPPGALLPFGGHKGYGLSVIVEMFAGALTGNGCANPSNRQRLLNGMFSLIVDPRRIPSELRVDDEIRRFIWFVKSSRLAAGHTEILLPGELESRTRRTRIADGIELDSVTWQTIVQACADHHVDGCDAAVIDA